MIMFAFLMEILVKMCISVDLGKMEMKNVFFSLKAWTICIANARSFIQT